MTTKAIPLVAEAALKKSCSAARPPAEAPIPTTVKGSLAREAKSTGAARSSGLPVAWGARPGVVSDPLIHFPRVISSHHAPNNRLLCESIIPHAAATAPIIAIGSARIGTPGASSRHRDVAALRAAAH